LVKNVQAIIDAFGGMEKLKDNRISLTVPGFLPLFIKHVGTGPRGGVLISIMHCDGRSGALMRDPELVVEVLLSVGWWLPISFHQDKLRVHQEAVVLDGEHLITHQRLVDSLRAFIAEWDRNIGEQGFVEIARQTAGL
jgi:hypothetical protein